MSSKETESFVSRAAEVVQDTYRAGFKDGYAAALAKLLQAARDDMATAYLDLNEPPGPPEQHPQRPFEAAATVPQTASGRAAPGSVKSLVRQFVLRATKPVTEAEFAAEYPDIKRPSRYMAFRALAEEGAIAKHGRAYVPAGTAPGTPSSELLGPDRPNG
jgi:hypothetical protein